MSTVIEVEQVSKKFETSENQVLEVLRNVSLSVKKGSFTTLIGPSGCGKSTLLNIVSGMTKANEGKILLDGEAVTKPEPSKIAMVFQESSLYPWKTAIKNVQFGLELKGVPKSERTVRADKYMALVGISKFSKYYPSQLSGGMQQRVSIARALAMETDVILMDEPFGALDEQSRIRLGVELTNLWLKTGKTILFVTHSLIEAAFLSDVIVLMSARPGRISKIMNVEAKRPRDIESPELAAIRKELWAHISAETMEQDRIS